MVRRACKLCGREIALIHRADANVLDACDAERVVATGKANGLVGGVTLDDKNRGVVHEGLVPPGKWAYPLHLNTCPKYAAYKAKADREAAEHAQASLFETHTEHDSERVITLDPAKPAPDELPPATVADHHESLARIMGGKVAPEVLLYVANHDGEVVDINDFAAEICAALHCAHDTPRRILNELIYRGLAHKGRTNKLGKFRVRLTDAGQNELDRLATE